MILDNCSLCPRRCPDRSKGLCGQADFDRARVAKTMLHRWEEPRVSGARGTGAVFFAGCNLRCVFCQNHKISQPELHSNTTSLSAAVRIAPLGEMSPGSPSSPAEDDGGAGDRGGEKGPGALYALSLGLKGYFQERKAATAEYTPLF